MLHDDSLGDDLARVIADIGLVQRVGDVATGGGEVGEVHHRHVIEVVIEVAGVIAARHSEQLRYRAQPVESVTVGLLRLG